MLPFAIIFVAFSHRKGIERFEFSNGCYRFFCSFAVQKSINSWKG
jgi:hypothetical protein